MVEPSAQITEEDVLTFVSASISSVWELELLLLFHREPERQWGPAQIDRQLRASTTVVGSALRRLSALGLVAEPTHELFQYRPATPRLHEIVSALALLYGTKPISVLKAVLAAPNTKLQIFSDAFRFKD